MSHLSVLGALLCALGFGLHVLGRWAEFWRTTSRVGLVEYLRLDPPGWLVSVLATVATYLVLPEYGLLGGQEVTPLAALTAGYMGSSIGAKLPALFGRAAGVR